MCCESWLGCMANGPTAFGSPGFNPLLQQLAQQRPALQLHCRTTVFDPFSESMWSELSQQ